MNGWIKYEVVVCYNFVVWKCMMKGWPSAAAASRELKIIPFIQREIQYCIYYNLKLVAISSIN